MSNRPRWLGAAGTENRKGMVVQMKKRMALALAATVLAASVTACRPEKSEEASVYPQTMEMTSAGSGTVAENERFNLLWDDSVKSVFIQDKQTGTVWGSTPYDYYYSGETSGVAGVELYSGIKIEYIDSANRQIQTLEGNLELMNGRVIGEALDDGFQVTYCFDGLEIAVPVQFRLREDSFEVRLVVSGIIEEKAQLHRVTLLPYMASVQNNTENGYLFVPSGSGALMTASTANRSARTFRDTVYGMDYAKSTTEAPKNIEPIRLPVFGAIAGDQALMGIIEKGAEYASIEASAGNEEIGYASICPDFQVRGSDTVYQQGVWGDSSVYTYFSEEKAGVDYVSVGYYPLAGDAAGYTGMAGRYAEYLEDTAGLASQGETPQLFLELMGGVLSRESFLGFSYDTLTPATTFSQAREILEDVLTGTGVEPVVRLMGFGDSGVDVGKIGGGFSFPNVLGGQKGMTALREFCETKGIALFTDFDLVRFRRSGEGFRLRSHSAQKITGLPAWQYVYSPVSLSYSEEHYYYGLLSRGKLESATERLLEKVGNMDVEGISLDTLGRMTYSDYRDSAYALRNGMGEQVASLLQKVRDSGHSLMLSSPNAYAAGGADCIFASPDASARFDALDEEVPFYQMVFRGRIPISLTAVNMAADMEDRFLKAVETGSALTFSLIAEYDDAFAYTLQSGLGTALYSDNREQLISMVERTRDYYAAVDGCRITGHSFLMEEVRRTDFENGVSVVVNYSESAVDTPLGTVEAGGFIFAREG